MLQQRRETCALCGAPIVGRRRTFCGHDCKRRHDRAAFAEAYRTDAGVRTKQRSRQIAWRRHREVQPCESCGATEDVQRHHHRGYDRPLDIQWVCRVCHAALHRQERQAAA